MASLTFVAVPASTVSRSSFSRPCVALRPARPLRLKRYRPCTPLASATSSSSSSSAPAASAFDALHPDAVRHLQNGSDVRGVASDFDPSMPVTLPPHLVTLIVTSFIRVVAARLGKSVLSMRFAVGRDSRLSGPSLLSAATRGARATGCDEVADFGLCTTPAMFMATVLDGHAYDCTVMLTASHLPSNRNGLKFFTAEGSANKADIKQILTHTIDLLSKGYMVPDQFPAATCTVDFLDVYARHLRGVISHALPDKDSEKPLQGYTIVVDAGNGAGGFFADRVLQPLGANVIGQFLDPDGSFPNHVPNPEDPGAVSATRDAVAKSNADIGVIFDTDVDRAGFVDASGAAINRNALIAMLAAIVLRDSPGSTIVTDSVTSDGLARFITARGGKHMRYRKGYKNVIDKAIELNEQGTQTELAIETSGHGAMRENYMLDDGAYLAVKILIELVRNAQFANILDDLDEPTEEFEFRLPFVDPHDFQQYGKGVVEAFASVANDVDGWTTERENHEGFRIAVEQSDGKMGWLLLRQSLHDPLLPLNVESEVQGGARDIVNVLVNDFFPQFPNIDVSPLRKFLDQHA